jgi:hypothetical protein
VLTRELDKLATVTDAFVVEGVGTFLFDVLDQRGPVPDLAFASFCRDAIEDSRSAMSVVGAQAMVLVVALGPAEVRSDAESVLAAAPDQIRAELPSWHEHLGAVHLVEGAALRTSDGRELVLHLLFDYDTPGAGSRHLLTVAIERDLARIQLLDVRGRDVDDSLAPMASVYAESQDPTWTWVSAAEVGDLVADAVRETARHSPHDWPVLDVEGSPTVAWTLGVRRLEQVTGLLLGPGEAGQ